VVESLYSNSAYVPASKSLETTPVLAGFCRRRSVGGASFLLASQLPYRASFLCRYHGAAMCAAHIATELEAFLALVERKHGLTRSAIARRGCYLSHETGTHATPASSCAANEIHALRQCFGADDCRGRGRRRRRAPRARSSTSTSAGA